MRNLYKILQSFLVSLLCVVFALAVYALLPFKVTNESSVEANSRIIGGTPATASDVQGYVVVEANTTGGSFRCGGMLIDPEWVLTIDRCVDGYKTIAGKPDIRVGIGCLSNVPNCLDSANKGTLFHKRPRLVVNTLKVVKNATASLVLLKIPRTVLGSGVAVFSLATEADIAALTSSPYMLSLGNISASSASSSPKTLMKGNIKFATDGVCQTAFGGKYKASLMNCVDGKADKKVFCFDVGSPILGVIGQQPVAYGIMLAETSVGVAPANRCKPSMSRMAYVDLTLPVTRNWIRKTVRTQTKRPLVTRLDGLYGDATIAPNDTTRTIDISPVFPTGIRLGSVTATSLSVSENGVVALGSGVAIPMNGFDLTRWRGAPLFAPFAADANTANPQLRAPIGDLFVQGKNAIWSSVDPQKRSVTITWEAIQPAWSTAALSNAQNTFQLILQNMNNGDVKVVFTYGMMSWGFGTKNCNGTCDYSTARRAQIGVSAGNGTVSIHTASAKPNQLDLLTAQGSTYLVIRAGKAGAWGATPVPVATWTASATPTPSITPTPTASPTSTPVGEISTSGLLAWYPLNGVQVSGSTYPTDRRGIFGYGTWFDGTNDFHQTQLSLANKSFTIAYWAAHDDWARGDMVITAGEGASNNSVLHIGSRGLDGVGKWVTCSFYSNDLNVALPISFDGTAWHHYACTYDVLSNVRTLYVDGVAVGTDTPTSPLQSTAVFNIGKTPWGGFFKGQVRDVMVHGHSLTAAEIKNAAAYSHNTVMLTVPSVANDCEWVDEQGNVHEYDINTTRLSWTAAATASATRYRGGQAGYLATITSPEEHACLMSLITAQGGWLPSTDGPWIGGQRVGSDGLFEWAFGPEKGMSFNKYLAYTNWYGSAHGVFDGNPDSRLAFDAVRILRSDAQKWNNSEKSFLSTSIIEYTYPQTRSLTGTVFFDANNNQQPDVGDTLMSNRVITLTADLARPIGLTGGGEQFCARFDDGRASCWGRRGSAYRVDQQRIVPFEVSGLDSVTAISNGVYTSCFINNAAVSCVGQNTYGAVGNGTTSDEWTPTTLSGLTGATSLSTGTGYHHCAVLGDRRLSCWGQNIYGQIGNGTVFQADSPVTVSALTNVREVVTGSRHTCALKFDGTVWCWGSNDAGQLAQSTGSVSLVPLQVTGLSGITKLSSGTQHVCGVKSDTSVVCWGYTAGINGLRSVTPVTTPVVIENSTGTVSLSTGAESSCVTKTDTKVYCWGHVFHGEEGWTASGATVVQRTRATEMLGMSDAVEVTLSNRSGCYRTTTNQIRCWGEAEYGQLGDTTLQPRRFASEVTVTWQMNPTAARVARIFGGVQHRCAILTDMRVACWGKPGFNNNESDATNWARTLEPYVVAGLDDVVDLEMSQHSSCALNVRGEVWCWGYALNYAYGISTVNSEIPVLIPMPSTPVALSEGFQGGLAYIDAANSYGVPNEAGSWWTSYALIPASGGDYSQIGQLADGYIHRCLLKSSNGSVGCWGTNNLGQLAFASPTSATRTVSYANGLSNVQQLSAGSTHTCALLVDATVKCWGQAIFIDGTSATTDKIVTPTAVLGLTNVKQISSAERNCAVKFDGTLWCWGRWFDGNEAAGGSLTAQQVFGVTDAIQVDVSYLSLCVLMKSGDTWCQGWGEFGQLGDGTVNPRFSFSPISETWQMTPANQCEWVDAKGRRHTYVSVSAGTPMSWVAASTLASSMTKYGNPGYLATISSQTENQCLLQLMHRQEDLDAASSVDMGRWLGGTNLTATSKWAWGAGPEAGMTLRDGVKNLAYFPMRVGYPSGSGHYLALQSPEVTYDSLKTWSNPSSESAHIGAMVEFTSAIGDTARRFVKTTDAGANYQFDGVHPGSYTLTTVIGTTTVSKKVIIRPHSRVSSFHVSTP